MRNNLFANIDFPEQTRALIAKIAADIRARHGTAPRACAQGIYEYLHGRFNYGFLEGMQQGLFIRYPHEIKREWECIEAAVYVYALAEQLQLHPRMMRARFWRGLDTGHETVDVLVDGVRVLIDPLNSMFGNVQYTDTAIAVEDNAVTKRCELPCTNVTEIPRQTVLGRMEYYRSDWGILHLLITGQAYTFSPVQTVFVHLNVNAGNLEFQLREHEPFLDLRYIRMVIPVMGRKLGRTYFETGVYQQDNWVTLEGREPFMRSEMRSEGGSAPSAIFHRYPPLRERGRALLLREVLYAQLLAEQGTPLVRESPNEDGPFLFAYREGPMERLAASIATLERQGITPQNKHQYYDLREAYINVCQLSACYPADFERTLDKATLKWNIETAAKQRGLSPSAICKRMLKDMGTDLIQVNALRQQRLIPAPVEEMFIDTPILTVLRRLNGRRGPRFAKS